MAWRENIIKSIQELGIKDRMIQFINNFLDDRNFRVIIGNYSSESFNLENGIPQGSIISVILFLIHLNGISNVNLPEHIEMLLYADDIVKYGRNKDTAKLQTDLQIGINNLATFLSKIGLRINATKTMAQRFSRRRKKVSLHNFTMNGCALCQERNGVQTEKDRERYRH